MTKQNFNTEKETIINQIKQLSLIQHYSPYVESANPVTTKGSNLHIGFRTSKFTYFNYVDYYKQFDGDKNYHLKLSDDSLITFYYEFDTNGDVVKHNLSYIPAPPTDLYFEHDEDDFEMSNDNIFLLLEKVEKYVRMDYDEDEDYYQEHIHAKVHMHLGLVQDVDDEGLEYELRIPLYGIIFPWEFIYFVLKYVYKAKLTYLENLIDDGAHFSRTHKLSEKELTKFLLSFGINKEV